MQQGQMNCNIILQTCKGDTQFGHTHFVHEHVLGLVTSGIAEHYTPEGLTTYTAGTVCLFRRIQLMKTIKKSVGDKPFTTINIFLDQETLKKYSLDHDIKATGVYYGESNVLLDNDEFMKGYFHSLMPYFAQPEKLTPTLAYVKTIEAIELLLRNPALKNFLFDFSEPHKIDLKTYMERHYSYNIPLTQFAKLTGRSLSTFKRDFVKAFDTTPEKWLQKQRLDMAYFLISQKSKKPSDVYLEVGFENLSHFSTSFKKEFGVNASVL
jgi:AraC family transcriptional regulator, exoenzyme S synthesis regulatory protein ExsA